MNKILILESENLQGDLIRTLSRAGFQVSATADEPTVVFELALSRPDLVILDLRSCHALGCDTLERIRRFSSVPIIGLVAPGDKEAAVASLNGGADDIMTRPIDLTELQARIRALLRRTQRCTA
jgi:DNA-binding response OmpR family regulator